ncbi:MAG: tRNA 2-thiouridine(34) synthase MnmA [Betaproteobacteria bacterium]
MTKRVLVAMSGGVDSSVTAALLLKQGMDVEGVTMKLTAGLCCDIGSAQAVCRHVGVPHRVIDAQAEFSKNIIDDFISEYSHGRTPNPCIRCNDLIKFHLLLQHARTNGFDYLATGHYARIERDAQSSRCLLEKGVDEGKDQSYFLYRLTQDQMKHVLFPLGNMRKTEVRSFARALKLPAAERPESQEICFVPDNDYRSFLKEHAPETLKTGEIVLADGSVVGTHDGIEFFTVGQRRRLGVAAGERLYVARIEPDTNRVVLGKLSELQTRAMFVLNPNFIATNELRSSMKVSVKIRYRSPFVPASIEPSGRNAVRVVFEEPVKGVCPGQAAVFYDGDTVVGGGIIEATKTV